MAKFLFAYHGGGMPESKKEQARVMAAWGAWFGSLGEAVVDGGAPTGASATVASGGKSSSGGGANPVSGYSLVTAKNLKDAIAKAKGCPVLGSGGSVEVCETIEIGV